MLIQQRVEKMIKKGFQRIEPDLEWLPDSEEVIRLLVDHERDGKAREVVDFLLQGKSPDDPNNPKQHLAMPQGTRVVKMWKVKNAFLERIYNAHRELIKRENGGNENELYGWHAPGQNTEEVRVSLCRLGVDNRFWKPGFFGNGAYFATYPLKSHSFAQSQGAAPKVIFLFKVLCGHQEVILGEGRNGPGAPGKFQPKMKHHSVLGQGAAAQKLRIAISK